MARLSIDRALSAPLGVSLEDDLIGLFAGHENPTEIDDGVPQGSMYFRSNGEVWQKIGPSTVDWDIYKPGYKEGNVHVIAIDDQELAIPIVDQEFQVELIDGSIGSVV